MNADANRHARSEVVDINIGDEQRGSASEQMMMAALANEPERDGSVPLGDFEGKGLTLVLGIAGASGWTGPHDDAQDALDGGIEARLNCAGSSNLEDGVKGFDGGRL